MKAKDRPTPGGEAEPRPPAIGERVVLWRLANGQHFRAAGAGDFRLEGWRLMPGPGAFGPEGGIVSRPIVSRIERARAPGREEVALRPVAMAGWDGGMAVTVIEASEPAPQLDENKAGKAAPEGRAARYNKITPNGGNKEDGMAKGKRAKKGKKAADKAGNGFRAHNVVLVHRRSPKEGELPAQAAAVLEILKGAGGRLTPGELAAAIGKRIKSRQGPRAVLNLHRAKLAKAGFISVVPATT